MNVFYVKSNLSFFYLSKYWIWYSVSYRPCWFILIFEQKYEMWYGVSTHKNCFHVKNISNAFYNWNKFNLFKAALLNRHISLYRHFYRKTRHFCSIIFSNKFFAKFNVRGIWHQKWTRRATSPRHAPRGCKFATAKSFIEKNWFLHWSFFKMKFSGGRLNF